MLEYVLAAALIGIDAERGQAETVVSAQNNHGRIVAFVLENDLFGGTDRHYTNGLRLETMASASDSYEIIRNAARVLPFSGINGDENTTYRRGWSLSHVIYTASDISLEDPPEDDHPYAGYFSFSLFSTAIDFNSENTVGIEVGLIGPSAQGEAVQRIWHNRVLPDAIDPSGWATQLHDELVFAVSMQRLRRWDMMSVRALNTDAYTHVGGSLGTVRTDVSVGAFKRFWLGEVPNGVASPPRVRPAVSASSYLERSGGMNTHIFGGVSGTWVVRDIFLDGNTFRSSRSVDKRDFVMSAQVGIAVQIQGWRVAYTHVARTQQFANQREPHRFGSLSFSFVR